MQVTLFGTYGCHLCEQALALIREVQSELNLTIEEVDIANDDELVDRYGILIPVLRHDGRELNWPFDQADLKRFLTVDAEGERK
ncbi:MAG: hypothetical protein CNE99_08015 [OM182 bacterium MED-G24]|uniref:Thioredoxin family protein n=1 Tax=OM182 bacterium MED-G24 TaxID=1986255 RepID=A0A2A5WM60_9GAMM|nr:MAG: hypothetical protein CNE99_08015 [OM182 bacterium MED-G24]|tara:strand:- start:108 stop:359 length:252 start_codon:yes stop_codon:yes gene_type:complete